MEHDFESLSVSLECDFENFDSCGWHNVDTDDQDWTVHSGKTPSSRTGPKGDFSDSGVTKTVFCTLQGWQFMNLFELRIFLYISQWRRSFYFDTFSLLFR